MAKEGTGSKDKNATDKDDVGEVINSSEEKKDSKNVSVKGISKDIYRKILQLARDTGKSVGDLTNDAYKALLSTADGAVEVSRTFVQSARESKVQIISNIGGFFRTILAMNRAFTIVVEGEKNDFRVRIGVAEWLADLGMAAVESFFISPLLAFVEVPESLWSFEIEHQLWHFIENQMELGIQ